MDFIVKLKPYFFTFLQYFFLYWIFTIIFPCDAHAVPKIPTFGVSRSGATTTYTVGPSTYQPLTAIPSAGSTALTNNWGASSTGYATTANIPIGETIQAVKIDSAISAASLATAAITVIPVGAAAGVAIVAGSALYAYLQQANMSPDSTGAYTQSTYVGVQGCTCQQSCGGILGSCSAALQAIGGIGYIAVHPTNSAYSCAYNCTGKSPLTVPINPADAITSLSQVTPSNLPGVLQHIRQMDVSGNSDPVGSSPTWTVPTSSTTAPTKTIQPDGSVSSSTTSTNCTQTTSTSFGCTDTQTVTTTKPDNSTQTSTATQAPKPPSSTYEQNNNTNNTSTTQTVKYKNDCETNPGSVGCSEFGAVPSPDNLAKPDVSITVSPTSWGSGSCPAPLTLNLLTTSNHTMSYQPVCDFMTSMFPVVIASAWLSAGFIVLGTVKD